MENKKRKNLDSLEKPRYLRTRKRALKIKKSYISGFMKQNRKEINERNNKLFREARKNKNSEE